jgi:hypothetical protein
MNDRAGAPSTSRAGRWRSASLRIRVLLFGTVVLAAGGAYLVMMSMSVLPQAAARDSGRWAVPLTPWGHPDIQGIWDSKSITPVRRPERFQGREYLTEAEAAELEREAALHPGEAERAEAAAEAIAQGAAPFMEDAVGSCLLAFNYSGTRVVSTRRTSLIVDPPDGRIPFLEKSKFPSAKPPPVLALEAPLDNSGPSDNPEDRPAIERCLGVTLPCLGGLCPLSRIVQSPQSVSIYYEQGAGGGGYRVIPLDGRPHLPAHIRQWLGNSVGRWEGSTLVVDTTNFTAQTSFRGSREHLHLVERFRRVAPDLLVYQIKVEDPTTFARPWTLELTPRRADDRQNQIWETSCHEGNASMISSLAGARALDRERK